VSAPGQNAWTSFVELDAVLSQLVDVACAVFGNDLVGVYLHGSFAVGDFDEHSDVDFLVVIRAPVTSVQERQLCSVHAAFPDSIVGWAQHLEGSYVPAEQLRRVDPDRTPWLYVDNGSREMEWSAHDNTAVTRWSLRERGVVLTGTAPTDLVDVVTAEQLRTEAQDTLARFVSDLDILAGLDSAWAQPYAVATSCRILCALATGTVTSKRAGLAWARDVLDDRWRDLIEQAEVDRPDPWARVHRPARPGSVALTKAFGDAALRSPSNT
jgi:hypothetical protein